MDRGNEALKANTLSPVAHCIPSEWPEWMASPFHLNGSVPTIVSLFKIQSDRGESDWLLLHHVLWPGKEWQSTLNDSSNLTACNGEGAVLKKPIRRLLLKKEGGIAAQAKTTHSTYTVIWNIMQQLRLYYYFTERCLWYSVDYKQQNGKLYYSSVALENI